jgi:2-polyprenyl-3-methyl-5-hydroxy-6-metoxy-1,4-benzoquinol methylase
MNKKTLNAIRSAYGRNMSDIFEVGIKILRERLFGVDISIFQKSIQYYAEIKGERLSAKDALARALAKEQHKQTWYTRDRNTLSEKMHFYQEVDIYPFRQPYSKRFGGFSWYGNLVRHFQCPSVLEYGCGSAVLTEYLMQKFPEWRYTVADIPSVTLDFIKWKKAAYNYAYDILTIGAGKDGIPLKERYNLIIWIICQDVLEHTPNPLEIVTYFAAHLSAGGVLVVDFIDAPGGENLVEAAAQRESVKTYLKTHLIVLKAIDEPAGNNGLYVRDGGFTI